MDALEAAALWARRRGAVNGQVRQTVRHLGERMHAVSLKHMDRDIYAKPVDRSSTGRPLWHRTRDLRAAERPEYAPDGAGVKLVNAMTYAEPRHEAGKPGRRLTKRPAHWRDEMREELRQEIPDALHAMNLRILRGG